MSTRIETARIVQSGMGGFLNPPGHPEHTQSVESGPKRNPDSCSSLTAYLREPQPWYANDAEIKTAIRTILAAWDANKPAIDSPEVVQWTRQVLGYFRGCYRGLGTDPNCWNAGKLWIDQDRDPVEYQADHAGVRLIRQYYPEYQPTTKDFACARWGKVA